MLGCEGATNHAPPTNKALARYVWPIPTCPHGHSLVATRLLGQKLEDAEETGPRTIEDLEGSVRATKFARRIPALWPSLRVVQPAACKVVQLARRASWAWRCVLLLKVSQDIGTITLKRIRVGCGQPPLCD